MSVNVRKGKSYTDLNHEWSKNSIDVSALSFHKMMQVLYKQDAMADWGSILALTYMAAQRVFPDYNDDGNDGGNQYNVMSSTSTNEGHYLIRKCGSHDGRGVVDWRD